MQRPQTGETRMAASVPRVSGVLETSLYVTDPEGNVVELKGPRA